MSIGVITVFAVVGLALAGCLIYGIIDSKKSTNKK